MVYVNFALEPEKIGVFIGSKDVDSILMGLSAVMPEAEFIPQKTCLILDEIQDCPDVQAPAPMCYKGISWAIKEPSSKI